MPPITLFARISISASTENHSESISRMTTHFNPCILIPVYNHEGALPNLIAQLKPYNIPCILIDDGSSTACAQVMRELAAQELWLQTIRQEQNCGKGSAVKLGLFNAEQRGFSHAVQIDADGQHDINDLNKFLQTAQEYPAAVITGQPIFDASIPKLRFYARYLTHILVWLNTLSFAIPDALCGYRVYPVNICTQLLRTQSLGNRMQFDVEILVYLYWQNTPIVPLPTRVRYPLDGVSHFRLCSDNLLLAMMHARLFVGMLRRLPSLLRRHCDEI